MTPEEQTAAIAQLASIAATQQQQIELLTSMVEQNSNRRSPRSIGPAVQARKAPR